MVSGVVDTTLRALRAFGINFISSAFALHADSVISQVVTHERRVVQGRIVASVGQFCGSSDRSVPGHSLYLHPFACVKSSIGAKVDCARLATKTVPFCRLLSHWPGLQWSGQVANEAVPE